MIAEALDALAQSDPAQLRAHRRDRFYAIGRLEGDATSLTP